MPAIIARRPVPSRNEGFGGTTGWRCSAGLKWKGLEGAEDVWSVAARVPVTSKPSQPAGRRLEDRYSHRHSWTRPTRCRCAWARAASVCAAGPGGGKVGQPREASPEPRGPLIERPWNALQGPATSSDRYERRDRQNLPTSWQDARTRSESFNIPSGK